MLTTCGSLLLARQRSSLTGLLRGLGYAASAVLGSVLAFFAAASYYDVRCGDPDSTGQCGLPVMSGFIGALAIGALVIVGTAVLESRRQRRSSVPD